MLLFLIKSTACMAILFLFYKLLLEKEPMHVFKRFYLLAALIASLLIPNLVFVEYVTPAVTTYTNTPFISDTAGIASTPKPRDIDVVNWSLIVWTIYSIGVLSFGFRFFRNLIQIISRVRRNPKLRQQWSIKVLLKEQLPPHTFFYYVFLNKKKFEANDIPREVLLHEGVHARQLHSIDVVFIEFLQVVLWFNPMVFFFKKSIKLNHEFLADSAVLKENISASNYQNTLLSYLSKDSNQKYQSVKMANAINYSSIKKRFKVMKKTSSKKAVLLRSILVLPLFALLLFGFSETKLISKDSQSFSDQLTEMQDQYSIGAYNILAKKYNAIPLEQRKIPLADLRFLEKQYAKLNAEQRDLAETFPECLPQNIIEKQFILLITNSEIILNGKKAPLNSFATTVDALTQNWEETEYTSIPVQANFSNTPVSFLEKVETEFQKTHFSKSNEGMRIFPKGYKKHFSQEGASQKQLAEYNGLARKYNDMDRSKMRILKSDVDRLEYLYGLMSEEQKADAEPFPDFPEPPQPPQPISIEKFQSPKSTQAPKTVKGTITPTPQKTEAPKVVTGRKSEVPAPPKPPHPSKPDPLDHIIEMAKQDATFYYKRKEISADDAIALLKKNPDLSISTTKKNKERPVVKISKNL